MNKGKMLCYVEMLKKTDQAVVFVWLRDRCFTLTHGKCPAKEQQKLSTNNIYTTHNLKPKKKNLQFANAHILQKDN